MRWHKRETARKTQPGAVQAALCRMLTAERSEQSQRSARATAVSVLYEMSAGVYGIR